MDNQTIDTQKKSGVGSIVATVIIVILIIVGALYFWGKRVETRRANQAAYDSAGTISTEIAAAAEADQITLVSEDDSIDAIRAENKSTNTADLNGGF